MTTLKTAYAELLMWNVTKTPFPARGSRLFKRSFRKIDEAALRASESRWHWFALEPNYGSDDSYGRILSEWEVTSDLQLLNISTVLHRRLLAKVLELDHVTLDCDEQYSGGDGNRRAHEALRPLLQEWALDGTFISESLADEACEGPTEVVLSTEALSKLVLRHQTE